MATSALDVSRLTTNRDQQYQLLCLQNQVLESIVHDTSSDQQLLDELCLCAEALAPNLLASVMFLDEAEQTLSFLSVPSANAEVQQAFQNLRLSRETGSCAHAVFTGEPTYVKNASIDPRWGKVRHIVDAFNIRSCWSQPIESEGAKSIGSFALTGFVEGEPDIFQQSLIKVCANLVSIILQRREQQNELWRIAHHDALTGLPNRYYVDSQLQHAIANAGRNRKGLGLMYIDMDNFKNINDSYGHDFGDQVLLSAMGSIKSCLREGDIVARLGGDEFLLILQNLTDRLAVEIIARKILRSFRFPIEISGRKLDVHFSIGISLYPYDGETASELLKNADIAMYEAKSQGKNGVSYFRQELGEEILRKVKIEQELREALALGEFSLYLQPQYAGSSEQVVSLEVLLRWHHPERGVLLPEEFIPIADQSELIDGINQFVIRESCEQGARWLAAGIQLPPLSINLGKSRLLPHSAEFLQELLEATGFPADLLEFEITESLISGRGAIGLEQLNQLRALGVSLVMDNFGTGYSSLSLLTRLPISKLKIDGSFIDALEHDEQDRMITRTIIAMGRNLQIEVVGEGVETLAQQEILLSFGCDHIQGNLRQQPIPIAGFEHWLKAGK